MTEQIELARTVRDVYHKPLEKLRHQAQAGDKDASMSFMRMLTCREYCLRHMGHMVCEEGRIVPFKPAEIPDFIKRLDPQYERPKLTDEERVRWRNEAVAQTEALLTEQEPLREMILETLRSLTV